MIRFFRSFYRYVQFYLVSHEIFLCHFDVILPLIFPSSDLFVLFLLYSSFNFMEMFKFKKMLNFLNKMSSFFIILFKNIRFISILAEEFWTNFASHYLLCVCVVFELFPHFHVHEIKSIDVNSYDEKTHTTKCSSLSWSARDSKAFCPLSFPSKMMMSFLSAFKSGLFWTH